MGEPGPIRSVIDVASEGFRLSLLLNAIGCEVASAGVEVHSISKGVTLFSSMLKQTGVLLQNPESVHSPEAVETVQEIAQESTLVFSEIRQMIERLSLVNPDGKPSPTIAQKFQWVFKKYRIKYISEQLESLKLSLSVMLGILQLGRLMASTSRSDPPEKVELKKSAIAQERAEAQNMVIVRYWQISRMDSLYEAALHEEEEDKRRAIEINGVPDSAAENSTQLMIEAAPECMPSTQSLAKMPVVSLGVLDEKLHRVRISPKEMVQVSDEVIDPLLDKWTVWHSVRERRHQRDSSGGSSYSPFVEPLHEDDEDRPLHRKFQEREESPHQGNLLEGGTTDWRQPHSVAAREDAQRLRRKYARYQPSLSVETSEEDELPKGRDLQKKSPRHHVIDSSSDSSDSEPEHTQRPRKSSGSSNTGRKTRFAEGTPRAYSVGPNQPIYGQTYTRSPGGTPQGTPRPSMSQQRYTPTNRRPSPNPNQDHFHHSVSSPLPPIHTKNPLSPYAQSSAYSPNVSPMPSYLTPQQYTPVPRYMPPQPNRMTVPPAGRPGSQDGGKSRSPGRRHPKTESEKRKTRQNLTEGAVKGLLGGGAIGIFLEALEGLSI